MSGCSNRHAERLWKVKPFSGPAVGTIVPVRYDPDDRGQVEVDVAAMNGGR